MLKAAVVGFVFVGTSMVLAAQCAVAEEALIGLPVDASLRVSTKTLKSDRCGAAGNILHFQVGDRQFAADTPLDGRLQSYTIKESTDRKSKLALVPAKAGCKGSPLRFVQVGLRTSDKALPSSIVLKELPAETGQPLVAKYIQHLGNTGACKSTKVPQLVLCTGSKTENGAKVPLVFMVVQDANGKIPTVDGIPRHAKCEERPDGMLCSVSVRLSQSVELSTGIDPSGITPASILKLGAELDAAGRRYILKN